MEIQSEKRFFTGWPCKQGGKTEGLLDASQFIDKNKFGVYVHGHLEPIMCGHVDAWIYKNDQKFTPLLRASTYDGELRLLLLNAFGSLGNGIGGLVSRADHKI
ncbi:hypothetical protein SDJN03_06832, partial [Cucurbita argyrosperma subsp. sororia]